MVQTHHVAKRQKTEECTSCMESVMFNSDSLFKIASYLPADGLLNLALACRRFGIAQSRSDEGDGDDSLSLVEETARRIVHVVATDEHWLSKYNYVLSLRVPLEFDQLVGSIEYVEGNKSRVVVNNESPYLGATAFSNNIMMAGKHHVSFEVNVRGIGVLLGVMRPGKAMHSAKGGSLMPSFYEHFNQREGSRQYNNIVNCCMYRSVDGALNGYCFSHNWGEGRYSDVQKWDGREIFSSPFKIGMLLDLDEGTLSVYNNGMKLGVMKRGLAGHYCWAVSLTGGTQVTIKRGTVPAS